MGVAKPAAMVMGSTESLLNWVAEADQLARMGSVVAARALLEGLLSNQASAFVSCKALYWVARAKIEEVRASSHDQLYDQGTW